MEDKNFNHGKYLRARAYFLIDSLDKAFGLLDKFGQTREFTQEIEKKLSENSLEIEQILNNITKELTGDGKNVNIPVTEEQMEEKRIIFKFKNDDIAYAFDCWFERNEEKFIEFCKGRKLEITENDFIKKDY